MQGVQSLRRFVCTCRASIAAVLTLIGLALLCGCSAVPYSSEFSCPPTYQGLCESLEDAYNDSVHGIDPKKLDEDWIKKRQEWEKKHEKLLKAREKAGIKVERYGKNSNTSENSTALHAPEKNADLSEERDPRDFYRERLFEELSSLLSEPEKPLLLPPKVVRVLVLSTLARDEGERTIFISPRYVYFMLDTPRWLLKKELEYVPFDAENPLVLSKEVHSSGKREKQREKVQREKVTETKRSPKHTSRWESAEDPFK